MIQQGSVPALQAVQREIQAQVLSTLPKLNSHTVAQQLALPKAFYPFCPQAAKQESQAQTPLAIATAQGVHPGAHPGAF